MCENFVGEEGHVMLLEPAENASALVTGYNVGKNLRRKQNEVSYVWPSPATTSSSMSSQWNAMSQSSTARIMKKTSEARSTGVMPSHVAYEIAWRLRSGRTVVVCTLLK